MWRLALAVPVALAQTGGEPNYADVFHHVCERDSMYAYIKSEDLAKLGSWQNDFSALTLNSQECGSSIIPEPAGDRVIFHAGSWDNVDRALECDTQMVTKFGKTTFWNMVQYTPPDDSIITRDTEGLFNFSCTYDMKVTGQSFELSVGHKIKTSPFDSIKFAGREGRGQFNASMELFKDETYATSYFKEKSQVTLTLEQFLFIEVKLSATDKDIALRLLDCWATPSANAGNQIRHTLIRDGCPKDETVEVMKAGVDQTARWKAQMFTFINEDEVWLHCDIQACNSKEENCEQTCEANNAPFNVVAQGPSSRERRNVITVSSQRKKREAQVVKSSSSQVYEPNILTTGPIINGERRAIQKQKQVGPIIAITVVGILLALGMVIGIYRVLMLKREETDKIVEAGNNNQITADWNLYSSNQQENTERKNPMLVY